jgi:O-antigen/teichoic acid export membrane protein
VAVILGRHLGVELYGVYGVIMSVLLPVELIGRLGIPQATSKLVAEERDDKGAVEQTAITLTAMIFTALAVAFFAAAPLLASAFSVADGTKLFRLAALDIPFYGMFFCLQHVLNGQRRFASEGLGVSLYGVSKALGVVALLVVGVTVESALIVNALASVCGCVYFASRLSLKKFLPTLAETRPILRVALPTTLFIVGQQLLANLDLWFLKWVGAESDQTIGLYVAANKVATLPNLALFVTMAILIPTVSRANSSGDRAMVRSLVRGATRLQVLVLLPACAYLAVRSEALLVLVYGSEFAAGALYQSLLVLRFGLLGVLLMTFCTVLIALGEPRRAALQALQLVPLGMLLSYFWIGARGAEGAALAILATVAVGVALSGWALARRVGPVVALRPVIGSALATALLAAVLTRWSIEPLHLFVEFPLYALACTVLLVVLRAVTLDELRALARNPLRRR